MRDAAPMILFLVLAMFILWKDDSGFLTGGTKSDSSQYVNGVNITQLGYIDPNQIVYEAEQEGKAAGRKMDENAGFFHDLDLRYYEIKYEPYEEGNMSQTVYEIQNRISLCWYTYDPNEGISSIEPIMSFVDVNSYQPYCGE